MGRTALFQEIIENIAGFWTLLLRERTGTGTLKHKDMSLNRSAIRVLDSTDRDLRNLLTHMVSTSDLHADLEEAAEQFVMDRMPHEDRAAYAAHLEGCSMCAQAVADAERFVSVMRAAGSRLETQRKKLTAASRR